MVNERLVNYIDERSGNRALSFRQTPALHLQLLLWQLHKKPENGKRNPPTLSTSASQHWHSYMPASLQRFFSLVQPLLKLLKLPYNVHWLLVSRHPEVAIWPLSPASRCWPSGAWPVLNATHTCCSCRAAPLAEQELQVSIVGGQSQSVNVNQAKPCFPMPKPSV